MKLVAPFWADAQTSSPNDTLSVVVYRVFEKALNSSQTSKQTLSNLLRVERDVRSTFAIPDITIQWALVVEWRNMYRYPESAYGKEQVSLSKVSLTDKCV